MIKAIDSILNGITMYRLVLYYLSALFSIAVFFSALGILPYSSVALLISGAVITGLCLIVNIIFADAFEAPRNIESAYITALILALIITPPDPINYQAMVPFLFWVAVWAMASKYIFAVRKKHLFNPAAFSVALLSFTIGHSASWWIGGNIPMLPFVLFGGLLIVRKLRRSDLVISFFIASIATIAVSGIFRGVDIISTAGKALTHSPVLFFAFVMITEPLTTPPTRLLRILYGAFTGFLFAPAVHFGSVYSTPELALLIGNIFSFIVSPKEKLMLTLVEKKKIATDIYDFVFKPDRKFTFRPGQYLEWTLGHEDPDSRGNRRYFTIASSPTEELVRLGVKFYENASSFKKSLFTINPGDMITASGRAGDFTMPKNPDKKLAFIAGGIGITPFRSMIKYLLDTKQKRPIILLYSNRSAADVVYTHIFDRAETELCIKTVYTLTEPDLIPPTWQDQRGFIDANMIMKEIPDYKERIFYISGPHSMIVMFQDVLKKLGVGKNQIKIDFFPGFV